MHHKKKKKLQKIGLPPTMQFQLSKKLLLKNPKHFLQHIRYTIECNITIVFYKEGNTKGHLIAYRELNFMFSHINGKIFTMTQYNQGSLQFL